MPDDRKPLPEGMRPEDFQSGPVDAAFETKTLSGDIRDLLLTHMRAMTVPWAMLNEQEQQDKITAVTNCAEGVVRQTMQTMVRGGFPSCVVDVLAFKSDKGVEIKLAAAATVETIVRLAEHGKGGAILVLARASDYFGERATAKPDKDQRRLPLEETDND